MRSRMQIGHTVQQMLCNSARCRFGERLGLSNFNVLNRSSRVGSCRAHSAIYAAKRFVL
jgi:hypothetical protein